eukprot:c6008_g1_i2.p1 GENE.c6008_g1_i2~~c6008_g1_i2.p1  ORF type:complete len:381 (+),score=75.10 c6008_g1_i2:480-1622(+)
MFFFLCCICSDTEHDISPPPSPIASTTPEHEDSPPSTQLNTDSLVRASLNGCRSVDCFERLNHIDEGTYGVVFRARDPATGEIVALKQLKMEQEKDGFPVTALREVTTLLNLRHENVVQVKEVVVGSSLDKIYMVMEYMEHDLKVLMDSMKQGFAQSEVKCLLKQLLQAIDYMHSNWILHRDLKTSNLLFDNKGTLKVCDFGLARKYGNPVRHYTPVVVTLWYRSPELLLGLGPYSTAVDMWSVGCIFAELILKKPLWPGKGELEQLDMIFKTLGSPTDDIWPRFKESREKANFRYYPPGRLREKLLATSYTGGCYLSDLGLDLLQKMFCYDPENRISAKEALQHPYFDEPPKPKLPSQMPTFPETHTTSQTKKRRAGKV